MKKRYVALRNLRLVIQKVPNLLSKNIQVFFCKYNDPIYVKMEKLELLISLATPKYMEKILNELKDYATEADIDFVRAAVRAIGGLTGYHSLVTVWLFWMKELL